MTARLLPSQIAIFNDGNLHLFNECYRFTDAGGIVGLVDRASQGT
jgi:hypothetical protein